MSIEGGPPDRLFKEYDDRNIRGQATGINGRLIGPADQSTGLIARAGQVFDKLFHRTIDVTTEGGAVYRINVKSAKKFITNNKNIFSFQVDTASLSDKDIETCIQELRTRQIAQTKWAAIQSKHTTAPHVYENLGTRSLFTRGAASPLMALQVFDTTIENQYALLTPGKTTEIDNEKMLQGDQTEL